MPPSSASLAALVGSRLCHDLISPVGAIQNGLELLSLSPDSEPVPEMTLIQDSCDSATARIRFFRVAFGAAGESQMMGARDIRTTLTQLFKGSRLQAEWIPDEDQARPEVQLAFLAILCCETALPVGGLLRIERDLAGWRLTAEGPRLQIKQAHWDHMHGAAEMAEITPDRVQFALLKVLATDRGRNVLATMTEDSVTVTIA